MMATARLAVPFLARHLRTEAKTAGAKALQAFEEKNKAAALQAPTGLMQFFEEARKETKPAATDDKEEKKGERCGRSWRREELRTHTFDDLHKLWYVLLKERNVLESSKHDSRITGIPFKGRGRLSKVKLSMARVKHVVHERTLAFREAQRILAVQLGTEKALELNYKLVIDERLPVTPLPPNAKPRRNPDNTPKPLSRIMETHKVQYVPLTPEQLAAQKKYVSTRKRHKVASERRKEKTLKNIRLARYNAKKEDEAAKRLKRKRAHDKKLEKNLKIHESITKNIKEQQKGLDLSSL